MIPTRRLACALLLLAACGGSYEEEYDPPPPLPPRGEEVELRRLSSPALEISDPGVLVIRDSTTWRRLWTRYSREPVVRIPMVNFDDLIVVALSQGGTSGCVNSAIYIERVEVGRDSVFVVMEPGSGGPEVTCAMVIAPVDVVAIPRSDLPIAYVGYPDRRGPPPPARWLLTAEQTDTLAP